MKTLLIILGAVLGLYLLFILVLVVLGKRSQARAIAGFIPDCILLFKRLVQDPRMSRRYKLELGLLIGYLALPIDLIPDFIPVAGQLDDAIIVAVVLRRVIKRVGVKVIKKHWAGPIYSLNVILELSGSR